VPEGAKHSEATLARARFIPARPFWGNPFGSRRWGFSFAVVGRGDPLMLLFKAMRFGRAGKSGRPSPLEPSLEVPRDIAHNQSPGFAVAPGVISTRAVL
jgi:hypothetical protein